MQNPELMLGSLEGLVILDEIQLMPELFSVLRVLVDRPENRCRFLILGSASPHIVKQAWESLAGHTEFIELSGFNLTDFHTLKSGESEGVGDDAMSPFIRHLTDLSLPSTGEYAGYTQYNLTAPVARLTVSDTASSVVTPGSDAVMCLSCHMAHASDYPDMLRWDYTTMIASAAGAAAGTGCFACHATKD